jgi:hypothetical protein
MVARCVWALADEGVTEHVCIADNPSARLWLVELTATLSHEEFARVAVTLWAIWYARRKIIHDGESSKAPYLRIYLLRTICGIWLSLNPLLNLLEE